ncbi:unnamed protein product [Notodromas monacha]|uniref:Uncharacterized protein n=1 Tax=Notodromas monacha TaxID=399045 RepID=A0A7R9GBB9_9CRUS|nr:unnamed protein product [Notodromas monacha]CAG0916336.1 unnamed protein product [Notodromas monacha]
MPVPRSTLANCDSNFFCELEDELRPELAFKYMSFQDCNGCTENTEENRKRVQEIPDSVYG